MEEQEDSSNSRMLGVMVRRVMRGIMVSNNKTSKKSNKRKTLASATTASWTCRAKISANIY